MNTIKKTKEKFLLLTMVKMDLSDATDVRHMSTPICNLLMQGLRFNVTSVNMKMQYQLIINLL